jgi:hypothetical protein
MNLFQVKGKHKYLGDFSCGFCVDAKDTVWEAAPIIKWMKEKPLSFIISYCKEKGWDLKQC